MGAMVLRHKWAGQPKTGVEIDWSNPLTKGLTAACLPCGNTFVELISGRFFKRLAPAKAGCTAQGRWLGSFDTGAGFFIDGLPLHVAGVNEFSLVSTVVNFVENNNRKRVLRFSDPVEGTIHSLDYAAGSSGALENKITIGSRASSAEYVSCTSGSGHTPKVRIFGASNRCGSPGEWNLSIDGQSPGFAGTLTYANTYYRLPTQIHISGSTDTSFPLNGGVFNLLFFSSMKTAEEINVLTKNPYQIFRPLIQRRLWVVGEATAGTDNLTASDLVTAAPVIGTPALGQVHGLNATGLTVSAPVLSTPAIGQINSLTASALVVGSPVLGTPSLTENAPDVDALTASDLIIGAPVLEAPSLGQIHVLGSDWLVTGPPVLGTPALASGAVAPITAAEVARTVTATSRMKTVTASARVKQVRYEVARA